MLDLADALVALREARHDGVDRHPRRHRRHGVGRRSPPTSSSPAAASSASATSTTPTTVIDASGCYVLPGGVDTHTHLENPALGITRSADDFTSGTVAAAHGGTTTIVDFVKKEPDASLYDSFCRRRARAESAVVVDIGFHPVVPPTALDDCSFGDLERLTREQGTTSWKFFMAYPGALMVDDPTLIGGMRRCAELGVLPMVHAENGHLVADATARLVADGKTAEHYHHDAHTHVAEDEAVHRAVAVARTVGSALFVVHVSSRFAAAEIAAARAEGLAVFGGRARSTCCARSRTTATSGSTPPPSSARRRSARRPTSSRCGTPWRPACCRRSAPTTPRSRWRSPTTCRRRSRTAAAASPRCPTASPASRSG